MDKFADFRVDEKPTNEAFAKLDELVVDIVDAGAEVTKAEEELKEAQEKYRQLEQFTIPEYMDTLGLEEFTTTRGMRVVVETKIRASIGKNKGPAFAWLIENGHDGIIKRTVVVAFNREQAEEAAELMKKLHPDFAGVKQDMKVEGATLTAFVKEQLKEGNDVPIDIFGIFEQRFAKITLK